MVSRGCLNRSPVNCPVRDSLYFVYKCIVENASSPGHFYTFAISYSINASIQNDTVIPIWAETEVSISKKMVSFSTVCYRTLVF